MTSGVPQQETPASRTMSRDRLQFWGWCVVAAVWLLTGVWLVWKGM